MNEYIKYPRTFHLPWSPGATSDDKMLDGIDHFFGCECVITEKLDGENTTIYYNGYFHARYRILTSFHIKESLLC